MPGKLGEMLLRAGVLNEAQLDQVLHVQAVYGGRLGTNLVEMGLIDEEELVRLLHEILGVPCLGPYVLDHLDEKVIDTIPLDMIRRHHVLPVALDGKRLTLAMADPYDTQAIDEIHFVTGLAVVPRVCSELRLTVALERYCGVRRAVRYIPATVGNELRPPGKEGAEHRPQGTRDMAVETVRPGAGKPCRARELSESLAVAENENRVVSALLAHLGAEFDAAAFWRVESGKAIGVEACGVAVGAARFCGHAIRLENTVHLQRIVHDKQLYVGTLALQGEDAVILEMMGAGTRSPVLLVPLAVNGKVTALIGVCDAKGRLAAGAFELQRVATMTELALEMLCLRKRIQSV